MVLGVAEKSVAIRDVIPGVGNGVVEVVIVNVNLGLFIPENRAYVSPRVVNSHIFGIENAKTVGKVGIFVIACIKRLGCICGRCAGQIFRLAAKSSGGFVGGEEKRKNQTG